MKKAWIYLGITVLINVIVRIISRFSPEFSEWYATAIYPFFVSTVGFVSGLFPVSLMEILLILLVISIPIVIIMIIIRMVKNKQGRKKFMLKAVSLMMCVISSELIVYMLFCEINYQRYPFSKYSGLTVSRYTAEELKEVIDGINTVLEEACGYIRTDDEGRFSMDSAKLESISRNSMESLAESFSCLDTYYPQPKPLIFSEFLLSRTLTCGIYSPFTIEANYNSHMPDSEKPFTVCHELSHMNGFMREDEANFISFLACRGSGDWDFIYSGYTRALVYCINAYYGEVGEEIYYEMYSEIPLQVRLEFQLSNEYWKPYRNTPVSEISQAINDTYLKINSQSDGRKSYGRFVDLLIADYKVALTLGD